MAALKQDVGPRPIALSQVKEHVNLLNRPAFEAYGFHYKPMLFFLWGLTPIVSEIVGRDAAADLRLSCASIAPATSARSIATGCPASTACR